MLSTTYGHSFPNSFDRFYRCLHCLFYSRHPITARIIKRIEYSRFKYIHAMVDPNRYYHQISVFHGIVGFKKLDLIYENSKNGRPYAALDTIEQTTKARGFKFICCHTQSDSICYFSRA